MNQVIVTFEELTGLKGKEITTLKGGVTNSSYLIDTDDGKFIIRIPGKGTNEYINRIDEINNIRCMNDSGVLPEYVYTSRKSGILISKYIENNIPMGTEDLTDDYRLAKITDT